MHNLQFTIYDSPIGKLLLTAENGALTGLYMEGQKFYPDNAEKEGTREDGDPVLILTKTWLDLYFAGEKPLFTPPLSPKGTDFQLLVWSALSEIPYSQTVTYGELARYLGMNSPRAVGNAVGRNPISIIVPCHRVIGKNGALTGYAGGTERKAYLLRLENIV